ncbi:MAG: hypothetical protein AB7H97_04035 [Pseudobdellovibrionaceae bacterium]
MTGRLLLALMFGLIFASPAKSESLKQKLFNFCNSQLIADDPDQFTYAAVQHSDRELFFVRFSLTSAIASQDKVKNPTWREMKRRRWNEQMLKAIEIEIERRGLN